MSSLGPLAVLISSIVWPTMARADDLEEAKQLATEATTLARRGDFAGAIEKFKAADSLAPSAANDCNIALAFVKQSVWHRADLFLQRCKRRWVREKTKPLPSWVGPGHENVIAELNKGDYAAVAITSTPTGAMVHSSAFGAEETLAAPVTLWLPFGDSSITASVAGYSEARESLSVVSRTPQTLGIALTRTKPAIVESTTPEGLTATSLNEADQAAGTDAGGFGSNRILETSEPDLSGNDRRGIYVIGGGLVALAAGGVFHALALGKKSDAQELSEGAAFDDANKTFSTYRGATIGFYAVGAAAVGVGAFLLFRNRGDRTSSPSDAGVAVGLVPRRGGINASARWRF